MFGLKKNKPAGDSEMTNVELLQGNEQWGEGTSAGDAQGGGDMVYPEPSVIMEAPEPPKKKPPNRKLVALVALGGALVGLLAFSMTEDGSQLVNSALELVTGTNEAIPEAGSAPAPEEASAHAPAAEAGAPQTEGPAPSSGDSAAPPAPETASPPAIADAATTAATSPETAAGEESEEDGEGEEDSEQEAPYQYVRIGNVGENSHQKTWMALSQLDEWRQAGQHDQVVLLEYFAHKKLWVRLSALEIAVAQKALRDNELKSAAKDIHDTFRKDQIRRWLKRVAVRDSATFATLNKLLAM